MVIYSPPRHRNGVVKNQLKADFVNEKEEKRRRLKKLSREEKKITGQTFWERLKNRSYERLRIFFTTVEELP